MIVLTQENLVGVSEANGELLWKRPFSTQFSQNAITPIIHAGTVISGKMGTNYSAWITGARDAWEPCPPGVAPPCP